MKRKIMIGVHQQQFSLIWGQLQNIKIFAGLFIYHFFHPPSSTSSTSMSSSVCLQCRHMTVTLSSQWCWIYIYISSIDILCIGFSFVRFYLNFLSNCIFSSHLPSKYIVKYYVFFARFVLNDASRKSLMFGTNWNISNKSIYIYIDDRCMFLRLSFM